MIRHFLKDGREVRSIAGHVVKMSEARGAYAALEGMKKDERVQKPSVYGPPGIRGPRLA